MKSQPAASARTANAAASGRPSTAGASAAEPQSGRHAPATCDSERISEVAADRPSVLAPHGRRIAAALLDAVVFSVIVAASGAAVWRLDLQGYYISATSEELEMLGWFLVAWMRSWTGELAVNGLMYGIAIWAALTIWLVRRRGSRNGQTIGKQCLGIRAARADHNEIGIVRTVAREIILKGLLLSFTLVLIDERLLHADGARLAAVLAAAVWYGPALADRQRRGLHDHLCATRVIVGDRAAAAAASPDDDLRLASHRTRASLGARGSTRSVGIWSSRVCSSRLLQGHSRQAARPVAGRSARQHTVVPELDDVVEADARAPLGGTVDLSRREGIEAVAVLPPPTSARGALVQPDKIVMRRMV